MVLEILCSVISMGVWVIGIYYFQDARLHGCGSFSSGCIDFESEILILEEASVDVAMDNDITSNKHLLCEIFDPGKFSVNMEDDKELPIATMIEPSHSFSQNESAIPTLVRSAFVNITVPRRSLSA